MLQHHRYHHPHCLSPINYTHVNLCKLIRISKVCYLACWYAWAKNSSNYGITWNQHFYCFPFKLRLCHSNNVYCTIHTVYTIYFWKMLSPWCDSFQIQWVLFQIYTKYTFLKCSRHHYSRPRRLHPKYTLVTDTLRNPYTVVTNSSFLTIILMTANEEQDWGFQENKK